MLDKKELIESLMRSGYLRSPEIVKTFTLIPREEFVPTKYRDYAYSDQPLPIGHGQTISAPHMVAIMTELLEPKARDKVLEVGAGSGYQAAILSRLVKRVYAIELEPELAAFARANLRKVKCKNVEVISGDGSRGYKKASPYDKIIVTCATPEIPKPLIEQLKLNGKIIAPLGSDFYQDLIVGVKKKKGLEMKTYGGCVFVPLRH